MKSVLVISDIDGTLIPHPFLSGKTIKERENAALRMINLFSKKNFGLVTGRRKEGFLRFFHEYNLAPTYPNFLGIEFATHIAVGGQWVKWREQNRKLKALIDEIERTVHACPELQTDHDIGAAFASGKLTSYYIELKSVCAQIEVQYESDALFAQFCKLIEPILNSHVMDSSDFTLQIFMPDRRIDILERNFVPKTGFWPTLKAHWEALDLLPSEEVDLVVLGDELYDAYMFREATTVLRPHFRSVVACAVGHPLPWATHVIPSTDTALNLVEGLLDNGFYNPETSLRSFLLEERPQCITVS